MEYASLSFPNPNPNNTEFQASSLDFMLQDYCFEEDHLALHHQNMAEKSENISSSLEQSNGHRPTSRPTNIKYKSGVKKNKGDVQLRVAFRTKTKLDVMDDGYKWRKYGKKMVKNSPYPRNYFKCSSGGCNVKKQVERDREDSSYVITTYEGVHNHESPSVACYNQNLPSITLNGSWSSQESFSF